MARKTTRSKPEAGKARTSAGKQVSSAGKSEEKLSQAVSSKAGFTAADIPDAPENLPDKTDSSKDDPAVDHAALTGSEAKTIETGVSEVSDSLASDMSSTAESSSQSDAAISEPRDESVLATEATSEQSDARISGDAEPKTAAGSTDTVMSSANTDVDTVSSSKTGKAHSEPAGASDSAVEDETEAQKTEAPEEMIVMTPADASGAEPEKTGSQQDPATGDAAQDAPSVAPQGASRETQSEPMSTATPASVPPASQTGPTERKGGFLPLLLGGLVAGGIGYGAHFLTDQPAADSAEVEALRSEIAELRTALGAVPAVDTEVLEAELGQLRAQLSEITLPETVVESADLTAAVELLREEFARTEGVDLSPLEARLEDVAGVLESQQQTMARAEEAIQLNTDQMAQTEERFAALDAELADLRDLAERRVAEAEAAIDAARAQSGLDSLRAALETGAAYADAVSRIQDAGIEVPQTLAASASTGIATVEQLQESFDQAARAALRVALQDAPAESTTDRLGNFFRAQVGARSIAPREGDDPDAVLSRASAAVEAGDLEAALSEIALLPEGAQAAMADWIAQARARIAARDSLQDLTTAITTE